MRAGRHVPLPAEDEPLRRRARPRAQGSGAASADAVLSVNLGQIRNYAAASGDQRPIHMGNLPARHSASRAPSRTGCGSAAAAVANVSNQPTGSGGLPGALRPPDPAAGDGEPVHQGRWRPRRYDIDPGSQKGFAPDRDHAGHQVVRGERQVVRGRRHVVRSKVREQSKPHRKVRVSSFLYPPTGAQSRADRAQIRAERAVSGLGGLTVVDTDALQAAPGDPDEGGPSPSPARCRLADAVADGLTRTHQCDGGDLEVDVRRPLDGRALFDQLRDHLDNAAAALADQVGEAGGATATR